MKTILSAIAVMVSAVGVASAADVPLKAYTKATAPMAGWTGFYVGANIGYGWQDPTVTLSPLDDASNALANGNAATYAPIAPTTSFDIAGFSGGLHAGYNRQIAPNWLVGIEADFNASEIKGQAISGFVGLPGIFNIPFNASSSEEVKWFGTVRARAGWLATPDMLLFATAGFAYGQVNRATAVAQQGLGALGVGVNGFGFGCINQSACFAGSSTRFASGWTAGGGLEYALNRNWTAKVEYLYVNLGPDFFNIASTFAGTNSQLKASYTDTHFNLVRIGASYRF